MSDRPSHGVACVLTGMFDRPDDHPEGPRKERKTWCGREPGNFNFEDASHAALAAKNGATVLICHDCGQEIADTIMGHVWEDNGNEQ